MNDHLNTSIRSAQSLTRRFTGGATGLLFGLAVLAVVTAIAIGSLNAANLYVYGTILVTAIAAVALNLLMGTTGQVSLGNAAFLCSGSFLTVWLDRLGIPLGPDILIAGALTALIGLIVGLPAIKLRGLEIALATLAAVYILSFASERYQAKAVGSSGFYLKPLAASPAVSTWILFGSLAVVVIVVRNLAQFRLGRALRMIRDHDLAAASLGIKVNAYKLAVFAFSSGLTGLAGSLLAHFNQSVVSDSFTLLLSVSFIEMIVIGGLDSITGAVIGAFIIGILPIWLPNVMTSFGFPQATVRGPLIATSLLGLIVILFVVLAPQGLTGLAKRLVDRLKLLIT